MNGKLPERVILGLENQAQRDLEAACRRLTRVVIAQWAVIVLLAALCGWLVLKKGGL